MLLNLSIIDLAVVKTLNLDLKPGMSVLTGETGAGKSILLTALGLALGDRADSGYVRPGAKRAEINLDFDLSQADVVKKWLAEHDLDDDNQCLVRRIVNQDGGSKAYINGRPVNLQILKQLSSQLVEIHGQHAHLTLLNTDEQRLMLDEFGKNDVLLAQLNQAYQQWKSTQKELQQRIQNSTNQAEREELLGYQLQELRQLDLEHFDYAALTDEHGILAHIEEILLQGQAQLDLLYENDQQSINEMLSHCSTTLNYLAQYSPEINAVAQLLNEAQIQIEEAALQLRRFLEHQEADPQRLEYLENQIGIINNLCRKHNIKPDQLPQFASELEQELTRLSHSTETITELKIQEEQFLKQYQTLSQRLSSIRQQQAEELSIAISAMIKELGMPQGDFRVKVQYQPEQPPKSTGNDTIEFLVCANPGLPPKPLAKVASGGELSRISLAIQVITSIDKTVPTMIFDEVDSGIGGGIAEIVGQKLRTLARTRQVICVTHLPQVASQGHQHLFVKKDQQETTASTVALLSHQERIQEIARMLGGIHITENTLTHAEEMLNHAEQGNY
jgi:DNA repair protein RecN (Recombination protein N)